MTNDKLRINKIFQGDLTLDLINAIQAKGKRKFIGWSDWQAMGVCNETTGRQAVVRTHYFLGMENTKQYNYVPCK